MTLERAIAAMQRAGGCEDCFEMGLGLTRATCDAPQPRWIGERYFTSTPRVAVVLINPGGGGPSADPALAREADLFREFHRTGDYGPIAAYFGASLARGERWLSWYRDALGLEHDEIAQLNVAWCPTRENRYPTAMLRHCFGKHTSYLLRALDPDIVLLSGSATHRFAPDVRKLLPRVEVMTTIHYAHRRSRAEERAEASRVGRLIADKSSNGGHESPPADPQHSGQALDVRVTQTPAPAPPNNLEATAKRSVELLDQLVRLGFDDSAFARLHHFRLAGRDARIAEHRGYCATTEFFQPDGENARLQRRLELVLCAYKEAGFRSGNAQVFQALADAAFIEIPPARAR